jgi:hypothetical protein
LTVSFCLVGRAFDAPMLEGDFQLPGTLPAKADRRVNGAGGPSAFGALAEP